MSFVFFSYASADKAKARPIVEALIDAGLKVWLDNPAAMGFTKRQIDDHFHHIEPGGRWRDKIDAGLRDAGAVLVCWSEAVKSDRRVWENEANVARTLAKLVACRIDDVDAGTLPNNHGEEQIADLRADLAAGQRPPEAVRTARALLVAAVKAKMTEAATHRFGARVEQRRMRHDLAPYLIDRTDQESAVTRGLDEIGTAGGVRPYLLAGPENECLDEFMVRLEEHTIPKQLGNRAWFQVRVEWPLNAAPAQFAREYHARLAAGLDMASTVAPADLANGLAERGRPVAVVSLLRAEEWQATEPQRIAAWLAWWRDLGQGPARFAAIPILCVKMPKARPGWKHCPSGCGPGGTVSNRRIWRAAQVLQGTPTRWTLLSLLGLRPQASPQPVEQSVQAGQRIVAPPLLHPVRQGDADRWLEQQFDVLSAGHASAKTLTDRLFGTSAAAKHGVALADFADALKPVFAPEGIRRTGPGAGAG